MDDDTTDAAWAATENEQQMYEVLSTLYTDEEIVKCVDPDWRDHYLDADDYLRDFRKYSAADWRELLNTLAHEAGLEKQWKA